MLSNISFGSTYKISSRQNGFEKFWDFQKYALNKEMKENVQVGFKDSFSPKIYEYNA